ncbi:MAG TPA: hypothetical protein VFA15_02095, partial [Nitrososphaera sp.]|nr:hypothetical protein [Nitrososphaera sp.]
NEGVRKLNDSFKDDIQKLTTAHGAWVDLGNSIQDVSDKWYKAQKAQAAASSGFVNSIVGYVGTAYDFYKQKIFGTTAAMQTATEANKALLDGIAKIAKNEGPKAALDALNQSLSMLGMNLKTAGPEVQDVAAKLTHDLSEAAKKATENLDKAVKKFDELQFKLAQIRDKTQPLSVAGNKADTQIIPGGTEAYADLTKGINPSAPVYTGTKEAMELAKIQTDQNEAVKEAQKVYTATRTATEDYNNQLAILDELLKQGKIDQQTYTRAKQEAAAKNDVLTRSEMEFGKALGESLKSAILLQSGFGNMAKAMLVDLAQLIIKMTLFKSITDSISAKKGGGGFLGS